MINAQVEFNNKKNIHISSKKKKLDIIIPSKNSIHQKIFLKNSIGSIINQKIEADIEMRVILCMDPNFNKENVPSTKKLEIKIIESNKPTQAHALNSGIQKSDADYVSFLEDDDSWHPYFIEISLKNLNQLLSKDKFGITSSNELEINFANQIIRVNDFPTPSGWFMNSETLSHVGLFNTNYFLHLDNDWLGKAAQKNVPRFHLIEGLAPINEKYCAQVRPWLATVVKNSKKTCTLKRHKYLTPLVNRLVHSESGMASIAKDKLKKDLSLKEINLLETSYGLVPW